MNWRINSNGRDRGDLVRPHSLGGEFGVFDFFEALVADFREPSFEGVGFGRWDGLDDSQKRLCIGRFNGAFFTIGSRHFYWGTICHPVGIQIRITLSELFDVILDVGRIGQREDDIVDGEIPLLLGGIPCAADLVFFGGGNGGHA